MEVGIFLDVFISKKVKRRGSNFPIKLPGGSTPTRCVGAGWTRIIRKRPTKKMSARLAIGAAGVVAVAEVDEAGEGVRGRRRAVLRVG